MSGSTSSYLSWRVFWVPRKNADLTLLKANYCIRKRILDVLQTPTRDLLRKRGLLLQNLLPNASTLKGIFLWVLQKTQSSLSWSKSLHSETNPRCSATTHKRSSEKRRATASKSSTQSIKPKKRFSFPRERELANKLLNGNKPHQPQLHKQFPWEELKIPVKRLPQKVCEKRVQGLGFRVRWVQKCWVGANKRERQTKEMSKLSRSLTSWRSSSWRPDFSNPKPNIWERYLLLVQFFAGQVECRWL